MAKRAKKIGCFSLVCFLILSKVMFVRAEALPSVMSGSSTLADCIMSYYSMVGCAVANTEWISTLYNSFGTNFGTIEELANQGYLVLNNAGDWEPVQALGEMIEQAPAYASLQLNEMFNVSAEEAATGGGLVAASGGSILAGSLGGVATSGTLPLLGGVTAAYFGGIGIGTLAAHALGLYGNKVTYGASIDSLNNAVNSVPAGGCLCSLSAYGTSGKYVFYSCPPNVYGFVRQAEYVDSESEGQKYSGYIVNFNDHSVDVTYTAQNGSQRTYTLGKNGGKAITSYHGYTDAMTVTDYATDITTIINQYKAGHIDLKRPFSPDLIGQNGNQVGTDDGTGISVPDIKPVIDPGTQAGKPLTLQDWLNFANAVKNNNNTVSPTENNAPIYEQIIKRVVEGWENPDTPNPDPDPWTPPVVDPVPDPTYPDPVPDQPTSENPSESENPQETEPLDPVDTGRPWMLPDLSQKFPFCIPWDIKDCFTLLKSNVRQAPHISWRFNPPNTPIDYTFNLDLRDFEPVATLLRTLELIAFIVGLAFVTRYIIGAS